MKNKLVILIVLLTAAIWLIPGCATFKSDMAGSYESQSQKNYRADQISLMLIFNHYRQLEGWDAIPKLDNQRERISGFDDFLTDALHEFSNLQNYSTFTEYASDVNEPERRMQRDSLMKAHDYVLKIKFMRKKSFAKSFLGTFFSSISLTLLPVPYTQSHSVQAELFNSEGVLLNSYSRQSSLTTWVQTLLIFAYPFHPEKRKKEELYVEFMHDIFRQIESEKILTKY